MKLLIADVNDTDTTKSKILDFDKKHPVDILIANAGVSMGTCESSEDEEKAFYNVFKTNTVCWFVFFT